MSRIRQAIAGRVGIQGRLGIKLMGHREYIGGPGEMWERIGQLQFDLLLSRGMEPSHHLLDIACGSLRLGVKAISYLEPGHYHGVEKERSLIDAGIEEELGSALYEEKRPELIVSDSFEFDRLSARPDYAMAQSLFSHLVPQDIDLCFRNLRPAMKPDSLFYATYFLAAAGGTSNPSRSHALERFAYSVEEMLSFGARHGFTGNYIGDWNHPRGQVLVEYRLA